MPSADVVGGRPNQRTASCLKTLPTMSRTRSSRSSREGKMIRTTLFNSSSAFLQ